MESEGLTLYRIGLVSQFGNEKHVDYNYVYAYTSVIALTKLDASIRAEETKAKNNCIVGVDVYDVTIEELTMVSSIIK